MLEYHEILFKIGVGGLHIWKVSCLLL